MKAISRDIAGALVSWGELKIINLELVIGEGLHISFYCIICSEVRGYVSLRATLRSVRNHKAKTRLI